MVFRGSRVVVFRAFFVFGFVPLLLFFVSPPPFFLTRTSHLASMVRTLLGGLGRPTLQFFVVAARWFLAFCVCPKFCDVAKQRRKTFWGGGGFIDLDQFEHSSGPGHHPMQRTVERYTYRRG